jgi:hypothetical protein
MATDNRIELSLSSSKQKVSEKLIKLSDKFFNGSIDTQKSGFMAYNIELLSTIVSESELYNSFLFNEQYINTAKLRSSILKRAADYGYKEVSALPETIPTIVGIKISESDLSTTNVFNIKKDRIKFLYGSTTYMLPGDVSIVATPDRWYATLLNNTTGTDINTGILSGQITTIDGEKYFIFNIVLTQLEVNIKSEVVGIRRELTYYTTQFSVTDELYNVRLYTIDSNGNELDFTRLDSFSDIEPDPDARVFLLESISEKDYQIVLDNGELFKFIQTGTELFLEIYETKGASGKVQRPTFTVVKNNLEFNRDFIAYSSLSSSGGRSRLELDDLKRDIIKQIQTPDRKTVVTEFDLKNVISDITNINTDDITMLIRRNDPIQRRTELFLSYKNYTGDEYLDTNTVTIRVNTNNDLVNNMLPRGTKLKLIPTGNIYGLKYYADVVDESDNDITAFYYSLPFPIRYNSTPVRNIMIFNNAINTSVISSNEYNSSAFSKFTCNFREIYVSYIPEEKRYRFQINLFSDDNTIFSDESIYKNIVIRLVFSDKNTNNQHFYIDCSNISESKSPNEFIGYLETDEFYDEAGKLYIKNIFHYNSSSNQYELVTDSTTVSIKPEQNIDAYIFYPDQSIAKYPITRTFDRIEKFNNLFNRDGLKYLLAANVVESITLFKEITEVFSCDVVETMDLANSIDIELVPVIGYYEYQYENNKEVLNNIYTSIYNLVDRIKDIKEEPSYIAIKFYNTYGLSDSYTNTNSSNLYLSLEVSFNTIEASPTILDDIKSIIIKKVSEASNSNKKTVESRNIYLSEIIKEIENNTPGLIQVRITSHDDNFYFKGYINYKEIVSDDIKYYVPSIASIKRKNIQILIK